MSGEEPNHLEDLKRLVSIEHEQRKLQRRLHDLAAEKKEVLARSLLCRRTANLLKEAERPPEKRRKKTQPKKDVASQKREEGGEQQESVVITLPNPKSAAVKRKASGVTGLRKTIALDLAVKAKEAKKGPFSA
jgi:seryl-tRNA synthetase